MFKIRIIGESDQAVGVWLAGLPLGDLPVLATRGVGKTRVTQRGSTVSDSSGIRHSCTWFRGFGRVQHERDRQYRSGIRKIVN